MKYRPKVVLTEATQWLKLGDHPQVKELPVSDPFPNRPPENPYCSICGNLTERHGVLDSGDGEELVCPSDYIVTDRRGVAYRFSRGEFESQYEPYVRPPNHPPVPISDVEARQQRTRRHEVS